MEQVNYLVDVRKVIEILGTERSRYIKQLGETMEHHEMLGISGRLYEVEDTIEFLKDNPDIQPSEEEAASIYKKLEDVQALAKRLHEDCNKLIQEKEELKRENFAMKDFITYNVPEETQKIIFKDDVR